MTKSSYTVSDITVLIGVNRQTVRRWIDSGKLKALKDNKNKFYVRDVDLEEFIIENPKYQKWMKKDEDLAFIKFCEGMLIDIYSMNARILGEEHGNIWNEGYEAALKEMELRIKKKIIAHDIPMDSKSRHYSRKSY